MHEPLTMLIVLPLSHVSNYRGPCMLLRIPYTLEVHNQLESGFKHPELHRSIKRHDLEGPVHGVLDPK